MLSELFKQEQQFQIWLDQNICLTNKYMISEHSLKYGTKRYLKYSGEKVDMLCFDTLKYRYI